jgi:putative nucleotidyltransferase with HDIG domain
MTQNAVSLEELEKRLEKVPSLPTAVLDLMSLDLSSDSAFDRIVAIAEEDPPLTSRLLALANSAGLAPEAEITNIRQAVSRIGGKHLTELIITMAMAQVFEPTSPGEKALWDHSILTAMAARYIAGVCTKVTVDPQEAYTCGLLHDIGRFVFFDGVAPELQRADEFGWTSSTGLLWAEREAINMDHAEIGWLACQRMGLPTSIADTVRYHHHYRQRLEEARGSIHKGLLGVVQTAEFIAALLETPPDPLSLPADELLVLLERRGEHLEASLSKMNLDQVAHLLPAISEEASNLSAGF